MGLLKIEGVTHWSIPVDNLDESEKFYGDLLGLKALGRLGNSVMSCFIVGDHNILLCVRRPSNRHARSSKSERSPLSTLPTGPRVFSPGGNYISLIQAAIGWSCETPPGRKACPNHPLKRSPNSARRVDAARI